MIAVHPCFLRDLIVSGILIFKYHVPDFYRDHTSLKFSSIKSQQMQEVPPYQPSGNHKKLREHTALLPTLQKATSSFSINQSASRTLLSYFSSTNQSRPTSSSNLDEGCNITNQVASNLSTCSAKTMTNRHDIDRRMMRPGGVAETSS